MTPDPRLSLALGLSQRVAVVSAVASLHVLVLAGSLLIGSEMIAPPTVLGVDVVAQGELAFEAGEAPAPDIPVVSPPVAEAAQPQRQEVARNEPQKAPPAPATDDQERDLSLAKDQPRPQQAQAPATPQPAPAAAGRVGAETATEAVSSSSRRRYAALVSAEINRHKFYPSAARGNGDGGVAEVTFEIGSDGALLRHEVTGASGDGLLDAAARKMVASSNFPPPPGGRFLGKIRITFRLHINR